MRRALGFMLVVGLLIGGASACSSSDDKKDDSPATTEADSGDSGDNGGSDSGNAKVVAYCKAVDEYVDKVKAAQSDPAKAAALASEGQELTQKATALSSAGLSSEDAQKVTDCTKKSTDALLPG